MDVSQYRRATAAGNRTSLGFDLRLGSSPEVALKYLQGYDFDGSATMHLGVWDRAASQQQQRWFTGPGCVLRSGRSDGVRATDGAVVKVSRRPTSQLSHTDAEPRHLSQCVIEELPGNVDATLIVMLDNCTAGVTCKFKVLAVTSC